MNYDRVFVYVVSSFAIDAYRDMIHMRKLQFSKYNIPHAFLFDDESECPQDYIKDPTDVFTPKVLSPYPETVNKHLNPHMMIKFLNAIKTLDFSKYDYVLRINLSTYINFPKLLPVIYGLPKHHVFSGSIIDGMILGMAMIFSMDCMEYLKNIPITERFLYAKNDDVTISEILIPFVKQMINQPMLYIDHERPFERQQHHIDNYSLIRLKNIRQRMIDIDVWKYLLNKYDHIVYESIKNRASYGGFTYYTDDPAFRTSIAAGQSEPYTNEMRCVERYFKMFPHKANTYIDVGAHIGTTVIPYSRMFKQCIGYEPNRKSFDYAVKNIGINNVTNCKVKNNGVFVEKCYGIVKQHNTCNSGCFYLQPCSSQTPGAISMVSLDHEMTTEQWTSVDFIKIDVEGGELYVLYGARQLIEKYHPLIQVESNGLSDNLYGYSQTTLFNYLYEMGYLLYEKVGHNYFFYYPDWTLNIQSHTIYCFWTGNNPMSENRQKCLNDMKLTTQCNVVLITPDNLSDYIIPAHPLHQSYQYLSNVHKADYLRTYFMRFYGGGYCDIKQQTGSWSGCFDLLSGINDSWICGYRELNEGCIAYKPLIPLWSHLIGNCAYICRPNTELTRDWYNSMITLLNTKLPHLTSHPARDPRDCAEKNTGYPIRWNEMLGNIFHRVCGGYIDHISYVLPTPVFTDYK